MKFLISCMLDCFLSQCLLEAGVDSALHVVKEDHFSILERFVKEDPTYTLQQVLADFLKPT